MARDAVQELNAFFPGGPYTATKHLIEPGDTLTGISAKYNTSIEVMQVLNSIMDPNDIYAGNTLAVIQNLTEVDWLVEALGYTLEEPEVSITPATRITPEALFRAITATNVNLPSGTLAAEISDYFTQPGDTLASIAAKAGIGVSDLMHYNQGWPSSLDWNHPLPEGSKLNVPWTFASVVANHPKNVDRNIAKRISDGVNSVLSKIPGMSTLKLTGAVARKHAGKILAAASTTTALGYSLTNPQVQNVINSLTCEVFNQAVFVAASPSSVGVMYLGAAPFFLLLGHSRREMRRMLPTVILLSLFLVGCSGQQQSPPPTADNVLEVPAIETLVPPTENPEPTPKATCEPTTIPESTQTPVPEPTATEPIYQGLSQTKILINSNDHLKNLGYCAGIAVTYGITVYDFEQANNINCLSIWVSEPKEFIIPGVPHVSAGEYVDWYSAGSTCLVNQKNPACSWSETQNDAQITQGCVPNLDINEQCLTAQSTAEEIIAHSLLAEGGTMFGPQGSADILQTVINRLHSTLAARDINPASLSQAEYESLLTRELAKPYRNEEGTYVDAAYNGFFDPLERYPGDWEATMEIVDTVLESRGAILPDVVMRNGQPVFITKIESGNVIYFCSFNYKLGDDWENYIPAGFATSDVAKYQIEDTRIQFYSHLNMCKK